jgi:hypothetical protein
VRPLCMIDFVRLHQACEFDDHCPLVRKIHLRHLFLLPGCYRPSIDSFGPSCPKFHCIRCLGAAYQSHMNQTDDFGFPVGVVDVDVIREGTRTTHLQVGLCFWSKCYRFQDKIRFLWLTISTSWID